MPLSPSVLLSPNMCVRLFLFRCCRTCHSYLTVRSHVRKPDCWLLRMYHLRPRRLSRKLLQTFGHSTPFPSGQSFAVLCYSCVAKHLMLSPRYKTSLHGDGPHTPWTLVPRKSVLDIPCASHCLRILVGLSGVLVAGVWRVLFVDCAAQRSHLTYHLVGTHFIAAFAATFLSLRPVSALRRSPLTVPGYQVLVLLLGLIRYFQDLCQHCCQQISAGLMLLTKHTSPLPCEANMSLRVLSQKRLSRGRHSPHDLQKYRKFITICTAQSGMSVYGFTALSVSRCRQRERKWHWLVVLITFPPMLYVGMRRANVTPSYSLPVVQLK